MATEPALRDRLAAAVGDGHDPVTTVVVLTASVLLGAGVAWTTADLLGHTFGFAVGALATAAALYTRESRRDVLASACYALAALVAFVPLAYELPLLLGTDAPLAHVLTTTDLLLFVLFFAVASVPALVGYRVATGPFLPRVRGRLADD